MFISFTCVYSVIYAFSTVGETRHPRRRRRLHNDASRMVKTYVIYRSRLQADVANGDVSTKLSKKCENSLKIKKSISKFLGNCNLISWFNLIKFNLQSPSVILFRFHLYHAYHDSFHKRYVPLSMLAEMFFEWLKWCSFTICY